ncbi:hypothetical protein GCM10025872_25850 [Barrientosiimonas endolithica]|uniref:Uncharacterized protein n=1 Tax=Barrientosiimonas endolithica TaxID=1535208 RepID=A0ABN6YU24_9MICO|nr:hypothetical protein GCM10025872_25850 [Barrientosiimonas endolithica]
MVEICSPSSPSDSNGWDTPIPAGSSPIQTPPTWIVIDDDHPGAAGESAAAGAAGAATTAAASSAGTAMRMRFMKVSSSLVKETLPPSTARAHRVRGGLWTAVADRDRVWTTGAGARRAAG